MKRSLLPLLSACALVCALAGTARAQNEPPAAPPPPASHSSGGGGHGPIGLGGIAYLAGGQNTTGLSLAYDPGAWHIDTVLSVTGNNPNNFGLGGRFWYHLAATGSSDLSAGAGLSYQRIGGQGMMAAQNDLFIELGGLIRMFLVQNVAVSFGAGIVIATADASGYNVGSTTLIGAAGVHYFF